MSPRPNIIYVVAHDLGKEAGLYGSDFDTPHLDAFGGKGVTFTQAFCTSPACSPSRGCAMTGQAAHTNGLVGLANPGALWTMPLSTRTIVDDLNDHGYETVHAGMQHERHNRVDNRYRVELNTGGWVENGVEGAIRYLEDHKGSDKPFYLNLGTNEVHSGQWETYKFDRTHSRKDIYGMDDPDEVRLPDYLPDFPQVRTEWAAFKACVRYWDSQVGRLLESIENGGWYENTIVVVTTDHGVAGHRAKSTLYREGVDITLLMRLPENQAGGMQVDHIVQNIDILPTLMDACGLPTRPEVQGRSFWPLLTGGDYTPNEHVCLERNFHDDFDPTRSIRTHDFALIRSFNPHGMLHYTPDRVERMADSYHRWFTEMWPARTEPRPEYQLFDRRTDPRERTNVASDPSYADTLKELSGKLSAWMELTDDPILEACDEGSFTEVMRRRFEYWFGAAPA